jgi:hypothetical protein
LWSPVGGSEDISKISGEKFDEKVAQIMHARSYDEWAAIDQRRMNSVADLIAADVTLRLSRNLPHILKKLH